jgi:ABC-type phosphate transport system substrate-binding protein
MVQHLSSLPLSLVSDWGNKAVFSNSTTLAIIQPLPLAQTTVPSTSLSFVRLSDTSRLGPYSEAFKQAYERRFPDRTIRLNESTQPQEIDITGLGRSLTPEEISQGLQSVTVAREKIAIILGANNGAPQNLRLDQVAKILQGEITDWSAVGGTPGPIRIIARPPGNDTRTALSTYPILSSIASNNPANLETLDASQDTTDAILNQLGSDGISYAPASEVITDPRARVLLIDQASIDNALYPFSQPLNYVYGNNPSQATTEFINFIQTPEIQAELSQIQGEATNPTRVAINPIFPNANTDGGAPNAQPAASPRVIAATPISEASPAIPSPAVVQTPSQLPSIPQNPSSSQPTTTSAPVVPSLWDWLPLAIAAVGLAILGFLAFQRERLAAKRKKTPRPAPDYAARLRESPSPVALPAPSESEQPTPSTATAPTEGAVIPPVARVTDADDGPQTVLQRPNASPDDYIPEFDLGIDDPGMQTKLQVSPDAIIPPPVDPVVVNPAVNEDLAVADLGAQTTLQVTPESLPPVNPEPVVEPEAIELDDSGPQTMLQTSSDSNAMPNQDEGAIAPSTSESFFEPDVPPVDNPGASPPAPNPSSDSWDPWDSDP